MEDVFDIKMFNVIEDENYYYFFRALNNADNNDISFGITSENGKIKRIRTDSDRYYATPKYEASTQISLEEVFDHIKINYLRETNCISLSSSASVSLNYGRENYADTYTLIRIPKNELGTKVFNAGAYMLEEIDKVIRHTLQSTKLSPDIEETLRRIDKAKTQEELNTLNSLIILEDNDLRNTTSNIKTSVKYRVTKTRSINSQALDDKQNLEKNKIASKLMYLQKKNILKRVLPNVSNPFLLSTVGSAFSSLEFLHYNEITEEKIISIPKEIVDIFALLEQLPSTFQAKIEQLKQILVQKILNNEYQLSSFNLEEYSLGDNIELNKLYEITNGKIDYQTAKKLYEDVFYLTKSRKRAISASKLLKNILGTNNDFSEIIEYISKNTFGIEPNIINRQSGKGIKLSQTVNLIIDNKKLNLEEWSRILSEEELEFVLKNTSSMVKKIVHENYQNNISISKEEFYINAIIDSFDWNELNIEELSPEAKQDISNSLKEHNCIELYNVLCSINLPAKEISKIILTCTIKNIPLKDYDKDNSFTISELEEFIGYYRIEGSKIKLKNYQGTALKRINETLSDYDFAACILPTGAGKSFVALSKMLENPNQEILYLAPNDEILNQIKKYIKEYVYGKSVNKSDDEIVKEVFPNLTLATYYSLTSNNSSNIINHQYDLIILDELHRTGAPTWKPQVTKLLEKQEHAKVLGITATPERDVDGLNMANEIAYICGYDDEEIEHEKHIAYYMDIFEAIELGYIVNPKVVECEYTLETSGYIEKLNEKIKLIKNDELRKEKLAKLDLLRKKINQAQGVANILKENIKQGCKYIVFLPSTALTEIMEGDEEIAKLTGEAKVQAYKRKLQDYLKNSGLDCSYYSMLSEYSKRENDAALEQFENDAIDTGKTKFMIVIDKLNEGVHVKGVNGLVWFRALDESSRILFLQQLGRIIYSIDSSKEYSDEKRPVAIDLANNTLRVNLLDSRKEHEVNTDYDYISLIVDWYYEHGEIIPDINSKDKVERRYAQILFRVKNKYQKYAENHELMEDFSEDKYAIISDIIYFGDILDLWNTTLQNDLYSKYIQEEDIIDDFGLTGTIKDFYDLENEIDNITTDEKVRLYIELLNTGYIPTSSDLKNNFPGTNVKIKYFWQIESNRTIVISELETNPRYKEGYELAKYAVSQWLKKVELDSEKKIRLYIELLNTGYSPITSDPNATFPGTDVRINTFWDYENNKTQIIKELETNPDYKEGYEIAKAMVKEWLTKNKSRRLGNQKVALYIELLNSGTYKIMVVDQTGKTFPGTDIKIKSFWNNQNNRNKVIEELKTNSRYDKGYETAKMLVEEWLKKEESKPKEILSPSEKVHLYIELLNSGYIPINEDINRTFPGTNIKINQFWRKNRNKVINELKTNKQYQTGYDRAISSLEEWNKKTKIDLEEKIRLYIELLNTGTYNIVLQDTKETTFPGTDIKINYFWLHEPNRIKVMNELKTNKYYEKGYEVAKAKVNEWLEKEKNNLSNDQKVHLYIELLNTGTYTITIADRTGTTFPKTDIKINQFWDGESNRAKVIHELTTNPHYQKGYETAKSAVAEWQKKTENQLSLKEKISAYIELLNSGYRLTNDDQKNNFPGSNIKIKQFWHWNSDKIIDELNNNPNYKEGYEVAQLAVDTYYYTLSFPPSRKRNTAYKNRILELAKDNIHAKKIAITNGWLALSQAESEFQEVSSFTKAQTHLKQSMEVTKDGPTIH